MTLLYLVTGGCFTLLIIFMTRDILDHNHNYHHDGGVTEYLGKTTIILSIVLVIASLIEKLF